MSEKKNAITASAIVSGTPVRYWGYTVTTVIGATGVTLYDNTSAAGTVVDFIPAATAAGITKSLNSPIYCPNGLYANVGSTGTILFLYD